jgi:hypothetical protein
VHNLRHDAEDGVVTADGGTVLLVFGLGMANLVELRLERIEEAWMMISVHDTVKMSE